MAKKITLKDIWKVLHADLIGKDSHRGITLTYGWMANQVGHFALGFVPTFVVYMCTDNALRSLIYVASFWTLFEIYNASSPLYKKEYKGNGSFKIPWKNLTFDTFTDLCFFYTGGFSMFMSVHYNTTELIFFCIGMILLFFSIRFWILTKLFQQNAFFPYQFRLSQWSAPILTEYCSEINKYLHDKPCGKHFVVFGSKGKGKTTLMVGMANEVAISRRPSTYTTLDKWVAMLQEDDKTLAETTASLWTWNESEILLIDDINPGNPSQANKFMAKDMLTYIDLNYSVRNREAMKSMSVAWVIGSCANGDTQENWIQMIEQIGVKPENIILIDLDITP